MNATIADTGELREHRPERECYLSPGCFGERMDEWLVVSADWLANHRDEPEVRIVDVRGAWEFEGIGPVPGGVNIPFGEFRDESDIDPGTLPGEDVFATLLSEVGVEPGNTLVAYDDTHGVFAASSS